MANQIVLVTGGAKGVGRGISQAFAAAGATVIACGRQEPEAWPGAEFHAGDIRETAFTTTLIETIRARHGRLDVLVNNAGGSPFALADAASPRFHEKIIRLNLLAPLNLAQAANALMQEQAEGGVIINIGSVSASRASPGTAAYGAAKAGLASLTRSLAVEWAPKVRVVSVSPGPVRTEQSELHYGDAAGIEAVARTIPAGRLAEPADVGRACLWLASPDAAYVSGSDLALLGGGERPAFLDQATVNRE